MKRNRQACTGCVVDGRHGVRRRNPASAQVSFGIGMGGPGYYGPPRYAVCNPYSRYYDPYYCGDYGDYYGPPLFIDGFWFDHGRYRNYRGHRQYWVHNGWRGYAAATAVADTAAATAVVTAVDTAADTAAVAAADTAAADTAADLAVDTAADLAVDTAAEAITKPARWDRNAQGELRT